MTFDPNIPQASDDPQVSQGEILQNFQVLYANFGVNHVDLGAITNAGKHKFVEMPNQGSIPATISGEGTFYTEAVTRGGVTESQVFYTADAHTTHKFQITTALDAANALFGLNTNNYNAVGTAYSGGWSFLPGGLLLQYGTYSPGASLPNTGTIPFPVAFTSTPFVVLPVLRTASGSTSQNHVVSAQGGGIGTTSFNYNIDGGSSISSYNTIFWVAIGK